jgi:hypothetical protein
VKSTYRYYTSWNSGINLNQSMYKKDCSYMSPYNKLTLSKVLIFVSALLVPHEKFFCVIKISWISLIENWIDTLFLRSTDLTQSRRPIIHVNIRRYWSVVMSPLVFLWSKEMWIQIRFIFLLTTTSSFNASAVIAKSLWIEICRETLKCLIIHLTTVTAWDSQCLISTACNHC